MSIIKESRQKQLVLLPAACIFDIHIGMNQTSHNAVVLADAGGMLRAEALPEAGMTLRSLRMRNVESICQSRAAQFAACRKGYGPLIGPHFNQRKQLSEAILANMSRWPQTDVLAKMGVRDPLQHGIARYAPWKYTASSNNIRAKLSSDTEMFGMPLSAAQGCNFELNLEMRLAGNAFHLHYTAEADFPPVIGLHYYYALPNDQGRVRAPVTGVMQAAGQTSPIPPEWMDNAGQHLNLSLDRNLDHIFPLQPGPIELETLTHTLKITPESGVKSCIVFHPGPDGWVCIEPLSSTDPWKPVGNRAEMSLTIMIDASRSHHA
ncbi:MAG: hypothetical protein ACOYCD_00145 [Kiritimatiellia bacterium]